MSLVFGSPEHYSLFRKSQASTSITPTYPLSPPLFHRTCKDLGGYAGVLSQKNRSFSTFLMLSIASSTNVTATVILGTIATVCFVDTHQSDHRLEKSQVLSADGSMVECNDLFRGKGYRLLSISVGFSAFISLYPKLLATASFFSKSK